MTEPIPQSVHASGEGAEPVNIADRFYEPDMPMSAHEKAREAEGWAIIRDRATGRVLTICANSRAGRGGT